MFPLLHIVIFLTLCVRNKFKWFLTGSVPCSLWPWSCVAFSAFLSHHVAASCQFPLRSRHHLQGNITRRYMGPTTSLLTIPTFCVNVMKWWTWTGRCLGRFERLPIFPPVWCLATESAVMRIWHFFWRCARGTSFWLPSCGLSKCFSFSTGSNKYIVMVKSVGAGASLPGLESQLAHVPGTELQIAFLTAALEFCCK